MTEKILIPEIKKDIGKLEKIDFNDIYIAHSYERVMPELTILIPLENIGEFMQELMINQQKKCEKFLSTFINTKNYQLTKLDNIRSSELSKILENTYRSVTISLMDEWTKFAKSINVDLFQVSEAIRKRRTHSNIRYPGLGVGGYCLTKDPKFAEISAKKIFKFKKFFLSFI